MFRLDNILERWAELYAPLRHNGTTTPGASASGVRQSFFRISMIDANSYFVRNFNLVPSSCCAYVTHVDAELAQQNPKAISYRHVIYMLCKQTPGTLSKTAITDDLAATEARFQTDAMVQDLLAVLFTIKGIVGGKTPPPSALSGLPAEVLAFLRDTAADPDYREGLRGLHLDEAHWGTLPMMFNGWQICGLTLEQTVPRLLCVNPERYV